MKSSTKELHNINCRGNCKHKELNLIEIYSFDSQHFFITNQERLKIPLEKQYFFFPFIPALLETFDKLHH